MPGRRGAAADLARPPDRGGDLVPGPDRFAWRYLPPDFPPWQTVYGYFPAWRDDGTLARLNDVLRAQIRQAAGRNARPTAAVIDSQPSAATRRARQRKTRKPPHTEPARSLVLRSERRCSACHPALIDTGFADLQTPIPCEPERIFQS